MSVNWEWILNLIMIYFIYNSTTNHPTSQSWPQDSEHVFLSFIYSFIHDYNNGVFVQPDIDECLTGTHNCGAEFRCENKPGSFACLPRSLCHEGYIQDAVGNCIGEIGQITAILHSNKMLIQTKLGNGLWRCQLCCLTDLHLFCTISLEH